MLRPHYNIARLSAPDTYAAAQLEIGLTSQHIEAVERDWQPVHGRILKQLRDQGHTGDLPDGLDWDWKGKHVEMLQAPSDSHCGLALTCDDALQGLVLVSFGKKARLKVNCEQEIVYVEYLQAAPWNRKELATWIGEPRRFGDVGGNLIQAVIDLSMKRNCRGIFGLNSVPKREGWYEKVIGMVNVERDADGLVYFEMTPEGVERFSP